MTKFTILQTFIILSTLGTAITGFSLGLWILKIYDSTFLYSTISFVSLAPQVLCSPFIGSLIDRWDNRKTILLAQIAGGIGTIILLILFLNGNLYSYTVFIVIFLSSISKGFVKNGFYATTRLLVSNENLRKAKAQEQIGTAFVMLLSPIIAPFILNHYGLSFIFFIDIVSFILTVILFILYKIPNVKKDKAKINFTTDAKIVWAFLTREKGLFLILIYYFFNNIFLGGVSILVPPLVLEIANENVLGIIMAISGIGVLTGGIVSSYSTTANKPIRMILILNITISVILILAVFIKIHPIIIACIIFIVMMLSTIVNILTNTFWQSIVPLHLQGRMIGYRTLIMGGAIPLSYLLGGIVVDYLFKPFFSENSIGILPSHLTDKTSAILLFFFVAGLISFLYSIITIRNSKIKKLDSIYIQTTQNSITTNND
ncbi:MFS transporter [Sphingobacterium kitahiroshimense]|uniref:MFS transporter n=1 Tax=Sphingobacterium kitahiroshimense TaxID=470446 RepID=A0ABV0BXR8_9SPHI